MMEQVDIKHSPSKVTNQIKCKKAQVYICMYIDKGNDRMVTKAEVNKEAQQTRKITNNAILNVTS